METIKFQKNMFDRLLRGDRVYFQKLDDGRIILTDGMRAFVFYNDLYIDTSKCIETSRPLAKAFDDNVNDKKIVPTGIMKSNSRGIYREYISEDGMLTVWINKDYVKDFKGVDLYAYSSIDRVLVKSDIGLVMAAVMPIRMYEEAKN